MIRLLAVAYGLTIANLYYCQPLLPQMNAALLPMFGQVGYALGLVLVVPLGDIMRRRRLMCALLCTASAALLATSAAPNVVVLLTAGTMIGLTSASVVNVLVAYAAGMATDGQRGRAMATMLTGGQVGCCCPGSSPG